MFFVRSIGRNADIFGARHFVEHYDCYNGFNLIGDECEFDGSQPFQRGDFVLGEPDVVSCDKP